MATLAPPPSVPGLKIGLKCSVEIENPGLDDATSYATVIDDLEEDRVFIAWPSDKGQPVQVAVGSHVQVAVPTAGGATLFMDCEIVRRRPATAAEPIATLGLRVLAVGRQQQRAHFRLSLAIEPIDSALWVPAQLAEEPGAGDGSSSSGAWKPIRLSIADVSGGGVGLRTRHELPDGGLMRVRFPYPMGDGDFSAEVRIKSVIPLTGVESAEGAHFKIGTAFEDTTERTRRERLVRCIQRFQLEQRRRDASRQ